MSTDGVGGRIEAVVGRYFDGSIPPADGLPRYVAPLPRWLENVGLRLAIPIALVNLAGTAFGFWYYRFQLAATPLLGWPLVPDSPVATLFLALSLLAWKFDFDAEWLHTLAFFGCIKLGLWTPYVQLALNGVGDLSLAMYWFLVLSHFAMAVQAFLIHRYASFSVPAVAVATMWYGFNDLVDYFWPLVGDYHHTYLRAEFDAVSGTLNHALLAHEYAAAAAVVLTLAATFLALSTRIETLKRGG